MMRGQDPFSRWIGLIAPMLAIAISTCGIGATVPDLSGHGHTGTLGAGFTGATSPTLNGAYGTFAQETDTIQLAGNIAFTNQATYEAVVRLSQISYQTGTYPEGGIWDSWQDGAQDTRLTIHDGGSLLGYAFNVNFPATLTGGSLQTAHWYDLAYVYDGAQERLYIDGLLAVSRPGSGNISLGGFNVMSLGALARDHGIDSSFRGDLQSLRISDVARYSGSSYVPTTGYFSADASTQLLINLPEPSSATAGLASVIAAPAIAMLRRRRTHPPAHARDLETVD
jgi:hypothetical protein